MKLLEKLYYSAWPWAPRKTHGYVTNVQNIDDNLTFLSLWDIDKNKERIIPYHGELEIEWGNFQENSFVTYIETNKGPFVSEKVQEIIIKGNEIYASTSVEPSHDSFIKRKYEKYLKE